VIGFNSGSTGAVSAASCKGACGAASSPIDVVMVLDRTGSMTTGDVANVKNAALSVLDFYEPATQWIGMVSLPYGQPSNKCIAYGDRRTAAQGNPSPPPTYQLYPNSAASTWQAAGLSSSYKMADGTLNTSDTSGPADQLLARAQSYVYAKSDGQPLNGSNTNLGTRWTRPERCSRPRAATTSPT
jgi:hypothetical protein